MAAKSDKISERNSEKTSTTTLSQRRVTPICTIFSDMEEFLLQEDSPEKVKRIP